MLWLGDQQKPTQGSCANRLLMIPRLQVKKLRTLITMMMKKLMLPRLRVAPLVIPRVRFRDSGVWLRTKALNYEDPFNNPFVKLGKGSSTVEMCGKVYKLAPVTLAEREQSVHQEKKVKSLPLEKTNGFPQRRRLNTSWCWSWYSQMDPRQSSFCDYS